MKTVLITGAGRGIGRADVEKFLQEGYFVIGTTTDGTCSFSHENLKIVQLDLTNHDSISSCVETIQTLGKKINILINNAGVIHDLDSTIVTIENLRKTLEVNLIGTIDFTEKIIPLLDSDAHIVNISSSAGSLTTSCELDDDQHPTYKISKAAINMYTRILAVRLRDVATVSSVHPGWVKTDMGGVDAFMTPPEAAGYIYDLAISRPLTGQFWFKGEKFEW